MSEIQIATAIADAILSDYSGDADGLEPVTHDETGEVLLTASGEGAAFELDDWRAGSPERYRVLVRRA
jgi:hypothetical protein